MPEMPICLARIDPARRLLLTQLVKTFSVRYLPVLLLGVSLVVLLRGGLTSLPKLSPRRWSFKPARDSGVHSKPPPPLSTNTPRKNVASLTKHSPSSRPAETPRKIVQRTGKLERATILLKRRGGKARSLQLFGNDLHHGTTLDFMSMVMSRGGTAVQNAGKTLLEMDWVNSSAGHLVYLDTSRPLARELLYENIVDNKFPPYVAENQKSLFEYYKNDQSMTAVDAFLCTFPSSRCQAYFPFNKTIIFAPAHRYAIQRCSKKLWESFNLVLQRAAKSTNPRHYVAAFSRYDAEYLNYFTGLKPLHLFSSSRGYTLHEPYRPTRPEILIGPLNAPNVVWLQKRLLDELDNQTDFKFIVTKKLYKLFTFQQLIQHRAAVLFPYAAMTYGMTELYAMAVPLFVPSEKMVAKEPQLYPTDRTVTGTGHYCGQDMGYIVPEKHPSSLHAYSPESFSIEARAYWLKYADHYLWPHITYFDSIADLVQKLKAADLPRIHDLMVAENERREQELDQAWATIANGMDEEHRATPKEFHKEDHFLANL